MYHSKTWYSWFYCPILLGHFIVYLTSLVFSLFARPILGQFHFISCHRAKFSSVLGGLYTSASLQGSLVKPLLENYPHNRIVLPYLCRKDWSPLSENLQKEKESRGYESDNQHSPKVRWLFNLHILNYYFKRIKKVTVSKLTEQKS